MAKTVAWETEMKAALVRAQAEKKPILIDFFNPN
jgi:hypothetical protein